MNEATHATKSANLTRRRNLARAVSKRDLTAMKTIDARHARGIGRKVGVRKRRTSRTRSAVKRPCSGVHCAPLDVETSAERESEPAMG